MRITVKQKYENDPWLIVLCVMLAVSTLLFMVLSVRNAKPFDCDRVVDYEEVRVCEKLI